MSLTQRDRRASRGFIEPDHDQAIATDADGTHIAQLYTELLAARMALSCRALTLHDAITDEKLLALTIAQLLDELKEARIIVARCATELYNARQDTTPY
jgi:hypothetical protein